MSVGFDTGFFIRLLQADPTAIKLWEPIALGRSAGVISCLTIYELEKQGLRGLIARQSAEILVDELPVLCQVVWLSDSPLLRRAAQVAHGNGLAMADAVILVSLMDAGVDTIYTTDSDLEQYRAGPSIHRL